MGAIANEAELESKYIGEIEIRDAYSTVDLPADMPKQVMAILKKTRVAGRPLSLSFYEGEQSGDAGGSDAPDMPSGARKKSYNSKNKAKGGKDKAKPKSEFAKKKRKERKKAK